MLAFFSRSVTDGEGPAVPAAFSAIFSALSRKEGECKAIGF